MKYYLMILLLVFSSCSDFLEIIPPDGLVQNEFWKKEADVQAVLMGAYSKFAQLHDELFLYGELRADMLRIFNAPEYQTQIVFGNILPDNQLCEWGGFYEVINFCNFVIKKAPEVEKIDNTFNEYQMRAYVAEAKFLRGLAYFYLVRIFKDVPFVLEPTDSDNSNFFLPKTEASEILFKIKEDLKTTLADIREDYGNLPNNKGRANKAAINALIADIALWNFEYEECLNYINNIENLDHDLLLPGDYFKLYYPGNSIESLFEFQFDQSLDQSSSLDVLTRRNNGYYRASSYALEILAPGLSGEIIRGNAALGMISEGDYIIWKYQGVEPDGYSYRGGNLNNSQNWIIYRYSDVLLMKAEALSQQSNPDFSGAEEIINRIRFRAFRPALSLPHNAVVFEDAILLERAKELSFEGKRWFDLLRMGSRNNYQRKNYLINTLIEDVPSSQKLVLASRLTDPNGWYLPIHFNELEKNANLRQNPYYEAYQKK